VLLGETLQVTIFDNSDQMIPVFEVASAFIPFVGEEKSGGTAPADLAN
jgi:hypothetical protein